jgi:hypothetical protein
MTVTRQIVFQFIEGKVGKTGLTPTVDAWRLSDQVQVKSGVAITAELGLGLYLYSHADADEDEEYTYNAHTTDTGVVQQDVSGLDWTARIVDGVWDEVLTAATHNIPTSAGRRLRAVGSLVVREETAQGPGTGDNQIQLDAVASAVDGAYDPSVVVIVSGTGAGQARLILQYDGTTKTATVDRNWKVNPDDTSEFQIIANPGREHVNEGLARGGTSMTITLNTLASDDDDAYGGQVVFIRSGSGEDQARRITAYNGTTKIATVHHAWDVVPDSTSGYVMLPTATAVPTFLADAVWDALLANYAAGASFGELMQLLALSSEVSIFTSLVEAIEITADVFVSTLGNIDSMIPGTTRAFNVTIKRSGVLQDITGATVTYRVKNEISDSDADALLTKTADVATRGAQGVAMLSLTPMNTALAPTGQDRYHHDIVWVTAGGDVYVVYSSDLTVSERVSDA